MFLSRSQVILATQLIVGGAACTRGSAKLAQLFAYHHVRDHLARLHELATLPSDVERNERSERDGLPDYALTFLPGATAGNNLWWFSN
jgi:hypothetical protein